MAMKFVQDHLLLRLTYRNVKNQLTKQTSLTRPSPSKHYHQHVTAGGVSSKSSVSSADNNPKITMDVDASLGQAVKSELRQVLSAGLSSVMPSVLVRNKVRRDGDNLIIDGKAYPLAENVYMVGFGKAVAGMACGLVELLGERLKRGILSVPELSGARVSLDSATSDDIADLREIRERELQELQMLKRSQVVEYLEGARNNQPDDASYANTERIIRLAINLGKNDTLIALVSGGGSALLFAPKPPMKPAEKRELCRRLQNSGANITELNTVRKQMSRVKGGGLAKLAYPAQILTLIISDVVGDPIDVIASGPTCPVPTENRLESIKILKKYNLYHTLSDDVRREIFETVICVDNSLVEDGKFKFVENIIIGNNETALKASAEAAQKFDAEGLVLSSTVEGDVKDVSVAYTEVAKTVCHTLEKDFSSKEDFVAEISKRDVQALNLTEEKLEQAYQALASLREGKAVVLLAGGEPTVVVEGDGKGGRNQELALQFSLDWLSQIVKNPELSRYFVQFLSAATDGQDGPTDAAGAFGQPGIRPKMTQMMQELEREKKMTKDPEQLKIINSKIEQMTSMLPENVLQRNDTYNFYSKYDKGKNILKTGLTGTNVMDLNYVFLKKRDCECDIPGVVKPVVPIDVNDFLFDETTLKAKSSEGCENK